MTGNVVEWLNPGGKKTLPERTIKLPGSPEL